MLVRCRERAITQLGEGKVLYGLLRKTIGALLIDVFESANKKVDGAQFPA